MPYNNPIQQAFFAQQAGMSPQTYEQLMAAQQQQALAQGLLQEGETPIDTKDRQIGGMAYKISPLEGVAKLAQVLAGQTELKQSNSALANALMSGGAQDGAQGGQDPIVASMPPRTQVIYNRLMMPESFGGNPRAGVELYQTYAKGMENYNAGVGTNAAGIAPAGTMPPGVGGGPPTPPVPQPGTQPSPQPPQLGVQPPVTPVQGPQGLPPIPPQGALPATSTMPSQVDALNAYRQQNGLPTPPIDTQRSGMGLPVGAATPPGMQVPPGPPAPIPPPPNQSQMPSMAQGAPIPSVNASALQPPSNAPMGPSAAGLTPPTSPVLQPMPGEGYAQFQERIKAQGAGQTAQATKEAENLAEAQKAAISFQNQLPQIKQTVQHLIDIAPKVSYFPGTKEFHHYANDPTSAVNADFDQGLNTLKTFGTQFAVAPGMGRMDLPIIKAAQGATSPEAGGNPKENVAYFQAILDKMNQRDQYLSGTANALQNPSAALANTNQNNEKSTSSIVTHKWTPNGIVPVGQQ